MAKRYGWRFSEIKEMPWIEFKESIEILNAALKEEFQDQMTLHSFSAWQIIETLKAMFIEDCKGISFNEYVEKLGLIEKKITNENDIKMQKQQALEKAKEIVKIHRQGANQKND